MCNSFFFFGEGAVFRVESNQYNVGDVLNPLNVAFKKIEAILEKK